MVHDKQFIYTPMEVYYAEVTLSSSNSKAYIDFIESDRSTLLDSEIVNAKEVESPLRQLKIINDGSANHVLVMINESKNASPVIKVKNSETLTFPLINTETEWNEGIKSITIQAKTTNATVRLIGIAFPPSS